MAGAETLDDPILKQIEQGIDEQVPPEHRKMYDSIVVAGMNVMFSKDTSQMLDQQLDQDGELPQLVSDGIAKLIVLVFHESKQDVNAFAPAAALAAISLMCQALDYYEASGRGTLTPEIVAACTKATTEAVLDKFGITPDQLNQVAAAGQQAGAQQPQPGVQ